MKPAQLFKKLSQKDLLPPPSFHMPWRQDARFSADPYAILVSEIMLAQTQAARVVPFFLRFMERFPTLAALGKANLEADVLPVWRGLGYYGRARRLHQLAVQMGQKPLPTTLEALRALPGIGPYTAAAVMSFAHGHNAAAVDTNFRRVVQRVTGNPVDSSAEAAFAQLPAGAGPRANAVIMDLGRTLCTAGSRPPRCAECPLQGGCAFFASGTALKTHAKKLKNAAAPAPRFAQRVAVACLWNDQGQYFVDANGQLPEQPLEKGQQSRAALAGHFRREYGLEIAVRPPFYRDICGDAHAPTARDFCRCRILWQEPRAPQTYRWKTPQQLLKHAKATGEQEAMKRLVEMGRRKKSGSQ